MTKSYRIMHKFWLDVTKDSELHLAEQLESKKQRRQYTATIRNALKLFFSLSKGDISVLIEMFPWVKESLKPQETAGEKVLREQLERLERLLIEQGNKPIALPATTSLSETPLDEDLPSVFVHDVIADPIEARNNFAASIGDLFADDEEDLWA